MSVVPAEATRVTPARTRSSVRVWYSSAEVVTTVATSVPTTAAAATST